MAKCLVVLAACVLSAHAAQFYTRDAHSRVARSPLYYGQYGPPPPPPPPPGPPPVFFHTRNWSGLARSADGSAQGVFSGAAADADSLPTSGAAYSLASSGVVGSGSGCGQCGSSDFGGQSGGSSGSYRRKTSQYTGQASNAGSTGFGQSNVGFSGGQQSNKSFKESHFLYQSGNQFGSHGNQGSNGGNSGYSSAQSSAAAANGGGHGHDVESFGNQQQLQQQTENFGSQGFNGEKSGYSSAQSSAVAANGGGHGHDVESFGNQQQIQQQTDDFHSGSQGFSGGQQQVQLDSHFEHGQGKHQVGFNSQAGAGGDATQTQQSSNFDRSNSQNQGSSGGFSSSSSQAGAFGASGSQYDANRGDIGDSQGQFNKPPPPTGSFGAGSQISESGSFGANGGLSTSQQSGSSSGSLNSNGSKGGFGSEDLESTLSGALNLASQGLQASEQSGCSTCGKSNYALSNAKSHSGSAVALSIGG